MSDIRKGDVIKILHAQLNGEAADGCFGAAYLPAWAVALEDEKDQDDAVLTHLLSDYPTPERLVNHYDPPRMSLWGGCDEFHVVPAEEVPDDILVALTKYMLLEGEN